MNVLIKLDAASKGDHSHIIIIVNTVIKKSGMKLVVLDTVAHSILFNLIVHAKNPISFIDIGHARIIN